MGYVFFIISAAFSAIIMTTAFVFDRDTIGMTLASITRRPDILSTLKFVSTTARGSPLVPILHVPL